MNEPAYPRVIPCQDALAVPPTCMSSFGLIIIVTDPSSWLPGCIEFFQPVVQINWLELGIGVRDAFGAVGQFEGYFVHGGCLD